MLVNGRLNKVSAVTYHETTILLSLDFHSIIEHKMHCLEVVSVITNKKHHMHFYTVAGGKLNKLKINTNTSAPTLIQFFYH